MLARYIDRKKAAAPRSNLEFLRRLADDEPTTAELMVIALVGTLISLGLTGFRFGVANNIFHIPYALDLAARPEFAHDQFYQTLKYFTSIVWPAMRLFATESNVAVLFLIAHVISRAGAFVAIAYLLRALGVRTRGTLAIGLMVAAATPWLQGDSAVGAHGMFLVYFTHSEVTWPFIIGALLCTLRGRLMAAAFFAACTLSINAFVGIWLVPIIGVCVLVGKPRPSLRLSIKALGVFAVVSAPVMLWILSALAIPKPVAAFSFREYIRLYYPTHFLIEAAAPAAILELAVLWLAALIATKFISNGSFWRVVLVTAAAIFLAGIVLPYAVDSRLIFNLHLLRIAGVIVFFSVLVIIGACLNRIRRADNVQSTIIWYLVLIALTCYRRTYVPDLILALLICHEITARLAAAAEGRGDALRGDERLRHRHATYAAGLALLLWSGWLAMIYTRFRTDIVSALYLLLVLACFVFILVRAAKPNIERTAALMLSLAVSASIGVTVFSKLQARVPRMRQADSSSPRALADWLRAHPVVGPLLLARSAQADDFQLRARVPIWVYWKEGAAVMWYPPFYQQWSTRYKEVENLDSLEQLFTYAKANDIRYFIGKNEDDHCPAGSTAQREEAGFILCAVNQT
jgi:hypothetical protein